MLLQTGRSIAWVGLEGEEEIVAPRPDPAFFAACSRDGETCVISTLDDLRILDKESLQERDICPHSVKYFLQPSLSTDGSMFVGPHMGGVTLFDSKLNVLKIITTESCDVALFDRQCESVLLGHRSGKLCSYHIESAKTATLHEGAKKVYDLQWLPDGRLAVLLMDDRDSLHFGTLVVDGSTTSSLVLSDVRIQHTKLWVLDRARAAILIWDAGELIHIPFA